MVLKAKLDLTITLKFDEDQLAAIGALAADIMGKTEKPKTLRKAKK